MDENGTGVPLLLSLPARGIAFGDNEFYRVPEALISARPYPAEKIQTSQHIVMPARRTGQFQEARVNNFTLFVRPEQTVLEHEIRGFFAALHQGSWALARAPFQIIP